jgi:hypothetical protein
VTSVAVARTTQVFTEAGVPYVHDAFQRVFGLLGRTAVADAALFEETVARTTARLDGRGGDVDLQPPDLDAPAHRDAFVERAYAHALAAVAAADDPDADLSGLLDGLRTTARHTDDPDATYADAIARAGGLDEATPTEATAIVDAAVAHLATDHPEAAEDSRHEALIGLTAAVLARTPVGVDPEPPFEAVVDIVSAIVTQDPDLHDRVIAGVAEALESSDHGFDFVTADAWREAHALDN